MEQIQPSIDYETIQRQRDAARSVLKAAQIMHEETYFDGDGQLVRDPAEAVVVRLAEAGQLGQTHIDELREAGFEV